jgi:serine/threonine-protein kinase
MAPEDGFGYINVGAALLERATYQRDHAADPLPAAREAEAAFRQALDHHPEIWSNLADLHILVAGVELDRGRDPRDRLKLAGEASDRALALNAREAGAHERRDQKIRGLLERWQARDPVR